MAPQGTWLFLPGMNGIVDSGRSTASGAGEPYVAFGDGGDHVSLCLLCMVPDRKQVALGVCRSIVLFQFHVPVL